MEDNVYMLSERLRRKGYEVVVALNGAQGVTMSRSEQPAIILMDLDLPVVNGWDATRQIKQVSQTPHIPVIALSAHAMSTDEDKALEAGCDEFETRPVDLPRLLTKIERLTR